jgi:hypothetical protein
MLTNEKNSLQVNALSLMTKSAKLLNSKKSFAMELTRTLSSSTRKVLTHPHLLSLLKPVLWVSAVQRKETVSVSLWHVVVE